jgi:ketosteroid isomerase-like protein
MSRENVELVHEANDAFTRRDLGALLALADPDIEVFPLIARLEGGGPYRGHDGVRRWWENWLRIAPDFSAEVEEVRDLGDAVRASDRRSTASHGSSGLTLIRKAAPDRSIEATMSERPRALRARCSG